MATNNQLMIRLLQLPENAQKNVCRVMEPLQQLTLSTCHEATKNLVKSSGLKCKQLHVYDDFIWIKFNDRRAVFLNFVDNIEQPDFTRIRAHQHSQPPQGAHGRTCYWKSPLLSVRGWIQHLLFVLNRDYICYLDCENITFEFFQQNFAGLNLDHLEIYDGLAEHSLQMIGSFPRLKHVGLELALPEVDFRKVLMQNLNSLNPYYDQKLTLNDLLLCNSAHFECSNDALTPTDLNRFVKLWMKGSNPRMKDIRVGFRSQDQILDIEMILRGTNYRDQTEDRTFIAFRQSREPEENVVSGGYEINRIDGTKATITIGDGDFEMYIWT